MFASSASMIYIISKARINLFCLFVNKTMQAVFKAKLKKKLRFLGFSFPKFQYNLRKLTKLTQLLEILIDNVSQRKKSNSSQTKINLRDEL